MDSFDRPNAAYIFSRVPIFTDVHRIYCKFKQYDYCVINLSNLDNFDCLDVSCFPPKYSVSYGMHKPTIPHVGECRQTLSLICYVYKFTFTFPSIFVLMNNIRNISMNSKIIHEKTIEYIMNMGCIIFCTYRVAFISYYIEILNTKILGILAWDKKNVYT